MKVNEKYTLFLYKTRPVIFFGVPPPTFSFVVEVAKVQCGWHIKY